MIISRIMTTGETSETGNRIYVVVSLCCRCALSWIVFRWNAHHHQLMASSGRCGDENGTRRRSTQLCNCSFALDSLWTMWKLWKILRSTSIIWDQIWCMWMIQSSFSSQTRSNCTRETLWLSRYVLDVWYAAVKSKIVNISILHKFFFYEGYKGHHLCTDIDLKGFKGQEFALHMHKVVDIERHAGLCRINGTPLFK